MTFRQTNLLLLVLLLLPRATAKAQTRPGAGAQAPTVNVVRVIEKRFSATDRLPAELKAWQAVAIYPKVRAYVERIDVDRGSTVHKGQLLIQLSAPELLAQTAQAEATMAGAQATYQGLLKASHTPGAVSVNELELALQGYKADADRVRSLKTLAGYLTIAAPFSGIITERNVHPGALVGPPSEPLSSAVPMLRLEQIDHLRLVVPVPQADIDLIPEGGTVKFAAPAGSQRYFSGTISRISHALDPATRTMPVEADVYQKEYLLAPGMFVEAVWPVQSPMPVLFVPQSAIGNPQQPFVERVSTGGEIQKVPVAVGRSADSLVQVSGQLKAGDMVVAEASQELSDGSRVRPRLRSSVH